MYSTEFYLKAAELISIHYVQQKYIIYLFLFGMMPFLFSRLFFPRETASHDPTTPLNNVSLTRNISPQLTGNSPWSCGSYEKCALQNQNKRSNSKDIIKGAILRLNEVTMEVINILKMDFFFICSTQTWYKFISTLQAGVKYRNP